MEIAKQHSTGDEKVYVITTLGSSWEEVESMKRAVRVAKVQDYLKEYEQQQAAIGLTVDTEL